MRTNRIINIVIVFQIALIVFFGYRLNLKRNNILGTQANISPIKKETVQQAPSEELKYFYELSVGKTELSYPTQNNHQITNIHNLDGLNETKEYNFDKENNTYRIITLGDSFTYGQYVSTMDNWTKVLEKKLNQKQICKNIDKFEVINLGVHGYDYQYTVERYKRKGQKYNPDLVIWFLFEYNRITENLAPVIRNCNKNRDNTPECMFTKENAPILNNTQINEIQKNHISNLKKYYNGRIFFIDYFNNHQNQLDQNQKNNYYTKLYENMKVDKNNFLKDQHPSELGHKLISNIIYEQLFKMNQIPCEPIQ